ncbi:T9SS sorting signal type C domain-containing protein [Flavobacterium sp. SM2513]|uniref:T9SS sorting signal type C domain-containing protein n=1 Tax=Flavobacterium sp. SM2513 TaxID=3424766 RepID=UPI003D7F2BA5
MKKKSGNSENTGNLFARFWYVLLLLSVTTVGWGQILQWNTFGNAGTETSEPSSFNNVNISSSNLTLGPGIGAFPNGDRFGGNYWFDTGNSNSSTLVQAIAGDNYIQFIVTPNTGFSFTPSQFVFQWDSSATGPKNVALRSSADSYTTNLGTIAPTAAIATANTISISGLSNITTATTFRLYGYGATAAAGTGGFDTSTNTVNVSLSGTVTFVGKTSITTGDWNTAATWTPSGVPSSSDNVTIASGHIVTATSSITRNSGTTTIVNAGGTLATAQNYINNGTTAVNGSFRLNAGGWVSDAGGTNSLVYGTTGTLIFDTGGLYGANNGNYWPTVNGPFNVTVKSGTLELGFNRTVAGLFDISGSVTLASTLTLNGICQLNAGSFFNSSPIYGPSSVLVYNIGAVYGRGLEWNATAGAGYPSSVQLINNTTLNYPNAGAFGAGPFSTNLAIAKNLTIDSGSSLFMGYGDNANKSGSLSIGGNLINNGNFGLGNAIGGDFYLAGNWTKGPASNFYPNSRAVFFNGTTAQTITGATTFDYLFLNSSAGVTLANAVVVNNQLDFSNGKLSLGTNDLTIESSGTINGATTSKYVVTNSTGQLKRTVGGSGILFPVGNTAYNPITFNNSGTADVYGVRVANATPAGANATKTVSRQWITTEAVAGGSNLSVVAQYNTGEAGAGYAAGTDNFIGHYNGTIYTQQVAATHSGANPFTVASNANLTPSDLTTGTQYFALGRDNGLMLVATNLIITAITPASPTAGNAFSVTVRSQDAYGAFASVLAATSFTLTTNGNAGTIGGTVTGTINPGTNSVTVSGVILPNAGTGVTITATRDSGDSLIAGQSATFIVLGVATKLDFGTAPPATGNASVNLTTFTVRALRADDTLNNTYTSSITISKASGSGTLSGTLTVNAVAGVATFSTAQFDLADTYTISATASGLTGVTSGNIVISANPANGFFRSNVATGNWSTAGSWQSSNDGSTGWITAAAPPTAAANVITIRTGHNITVATNVTTDQLIIANGGQLTVNSTSGTLNISNGTGTDIDIQSGGILQVTGTATYASTIIFATSSSMNVAGKITIGDGVATNGSGYDTFATASSSQIIWNNAAIYEWNSNGAFTASGLVFFPGVVASTVPIFRITKIPATSVGGGSDTVINGLLQLNGVNLNWQGNSSKIFRNGIVALGTASMIRNANSGPWQIGDASAGTAEIGGSTGILTLTNPSGISITSNCTATLTSNTTITSGGISHFGILDLGIYAFSGTGTFAARTGSTVITSNTGGLVSAIAVGGTKTFEVGANYIFNANTTTPFPTGTFGNPASLRFNNANVVSNRTNNITVSGTVDVKGTSSFALNPTTNDLTLGGVMTIDPNATFDNGGENQINNSGGTGSIVINGTFITQHTKGFAGPTTAIPSITPTLASNSTVEYALNGNQIISTFNYYNITCSGSGTKTTQSSISVDTNGLVKITGNATVDATSNLAATSANNTAFTMDGGRLILRTGGTQPNMRGTYTLTAGVVEYADTSSKTIRNGSYQNIEVTGTNVGNSNGNITLNENGSFTVKTGGIFTINSNAIVGPVGTQTLNVENGAVFKTGDAQGFYGTTTTSVRDDIETINLPMNSTVAYYGSDQTITALNTGNKYGKLLVSGTGTKTLNTTDIEVDNSLEVTSSLLSIEEGKTLTVKNGITTVNDAVVVANGGSIIQVTDENVNTGKIAVARTTQPMNKYDYTYWSSPVAGNTLHDLSPLTHVNRYYSYNPDATTPTPNWTAITGGAATMAAGQGYIIRAPNDYATDTYTAYNGSFSGVPNNGTVSIGVSGSATVEKYNLVGNPYPSAISASDFVTANVGGSNNVVQGTLYFWTHNTPFLSSPTYTYSTGDYAAWNGSGSVATNNGGTSDNNAAPDGNIAAGQGFFVQGSATGGTAVFKNTMRVKGNNMQFFKSNPAETANNANASSTSEPIEKSRVWLNLQGGTNGFSQMLVGYIANATNDYDTLYDGPSFGGNSVTFYSVLSAKNLVIQGRALPFVPTDEVPIGYKTTVTGNLTISIDHVDCLMENQGIYLKDNVLDIVHDLNASSYTFAAVPGTFNNRFVLRYLPAEDLANPTFDEQISSVTIRKNEAVLRVNSPYETIDEVMVYDIMGRLIFEKKDCNNTTFEASHIVSSDQTLIVKVRLSNGGVVTKKVF